MRGCLSLIVMALTLIVLLAVCGFGWELGERIARVVL